MRALKIHTCEQRTPEWFAARLGKLTGSRAEDAIDFRKDGKEGSGRRDYRIELVCERITNVSGDADAFVTKEMQRGADLEPRAFAAYEAVTGTVVRRSGFIEHESLMAGCSLDGNSANFDGILELKCPKSATHLGYIRAGQNAWKAYEPQITHNLWITGADWCDFVSFDDRMPLKLQVCRVRVKRADVDVAGYEKKAIAFLEEVDREFLAISTMANLGAQLAASVEATQ